MCQNKYNIDDISDTNLTKRSKSKIKEQRNKNFDEQTESVNYLYEHKKYNDIIKQYFNIDQLKQEQFDIVKNLEIGKNVIGILPTGYGKSICFQLPYLLTKKNVIVISPLISLMADQQDYLLEKNIPVLILNSSNIKKKRDMQKIINGENKIIYITPEYLLNCEQFIKELIENEQLALICFDEVHVMSEWGNSFRDSYIKAKIIKEWIRDIPILALSATITTNILKKIISLLKLEDAIIIKTSFDRPNLYIEIREKTKIKNDLYDLLKKYMGEYIIIYCQTRDYTEKITNEINKFKLIKAESYHAGQPMHDREEIQEKYKKGDCKCIVATIAFGMGINIDKIRLCIHYNCPKNIEQYYQAIGRAGRDNKPAECYMFYSSKDFQINKYMLSDITDASYKNEELLKCKKIEQFVANKECRRTGILNYFGETNKQKCNNCDNCKIIETSKTDVTLDVCKVLLIVNEFDHFGKNTIINIIRGSSAKNVTDNMKNATHYGFGKKKSNEWWKSLLTYLINNDYLKEKSLDSGFGSYVLMDTKGKKYLSAFIKKYENIVTNYGFNESVDEDLIFCI